MASSSSAAAGRRATTLLDLPLELLGGRIVAALDAASRLTLFRCSHALARVVLVHAPGSKRLTHVVTSSSNSSGRWSATLADLIGSRWQPLPSPLGLELRITSSASSKPPLPSRLPPAAIRQHTTHLHLDKCLLTAAGLAAWQLHSPTLWPHLQHLTISDAGHVDHLPTAASLRKLRPIPRLLSFTLDGALVGAALEAVLLLAVNAQRLQMDGYVPSTTGEALVQLPRLTHADVERAAHTVVEALVRHRTLQHVTVGLMDVFKDLSQHACQWRTLTVLRGLDLDGLAKLPVAQLERLTVQGSLVALSDESSSGLAVLQRLHTEGRLVLRAARADDAWVRDWRLPPSERLLGVWATADKTAALVRVASEAAHNHGDITCLWTDDSTLPISTLRDEVVPLLQQSGRITTLCVEVWGDLSLTPLGWYAGLLGALPPCVATVRVGVEQWVETAKCLRALVQGGVACLTHPVTLTLLHEGQVSAALEAELRQIVASRDGAGRRPLLTLEVA